MQRIFHTVLFCHEDLTLLSILDLSWSLDPSLQSWLVMKSWIFHPVLTLTSCLDLSWSLESYYTSGIGLSWSPDSSLQSWLVMKPWLFLTVLTCHACINSSIQSCLVMKTWPLPPVLSCHEAWILHQVWSHHKDLTLLPSLDLSWKHRFFLFSFQSWIVIKSMTWLSYIWSCHPWLDSFTSDLVIYDFTLIILVLSAMTCLSYFWSCQLQLILAIYRLPTTNCLSTFWSGLWALTFIF